MSEVDYSIDDVLSLLRYMPKAHEVAAADIIEQLRQQLESAHDLASKLNAKCEYYRYVIDRANNQEGALNIVRNEDGQLVIQNADGSPFNIRHHNGESFYRLPIPADHSEEFLEKVANFVEIQEVDSISPKSMAAAIRAYFKSEVKPS